MKKAKCPLFIFLVIFAYFDSQEKVRSQTSVSICRWNTKRSDDNIKTFATLHARMHLYAATGLMTEIT